MKIILSVNSIKFNKKEYILSDFGETLTKLMKQHNYNSIDISRILGNSSAAVRHWKNGVSHPKSNDLEKIADIFNVTTVDLLPNPKETRKRITLEELSSNFDDYRDHIPISTLPSTLKRIKIVRGYPTSNDIIEEENMNYGNAKKIYIDKRMIEKTYQEEELEAVVMVGDSMEGYLSHGDVGIYYPTSRFIGSGKYVINTADGLEVRSIARLVTGELSLSSLNPNYPTETISKENEDLVEFLGLIIGRILKS